MTFKIGILSTHPIQYHSPWYRELASRSAIDLHVYYALQPTREQQGTEFGVAFEWDVPLLDGYQHSFLVNNASSPNTDTYWGCDTPAVAEEIRRQRFDAFVVHGWHTQSYWQAIRACWRNGTPVMVRGDSTLLRSSGWVRRLARWFTHRRFVPRFDAYLVVGRRAREYLLAYGADPARMESCPHFVDNERFAEAAATARGRRDEIRQKWGLRPADMVFLFAGKFIPRKRPSDFIRAMAMLRARGLNATGLMVGDGPLRCEVEAEIRATNAPVSMAGFLNQSAIPEAYAAADVLVLASSIETWGLVVNEAMACGLPGVVSDRVGCAVDLVADGETGFAYPCGDVPALANRLGEMATNPALVARLGTAAARRIGAYSVEAAADGLCHAVARVVGPVSTGRK